jgi:hypothetical protein
MINCHNCGSNNLAFSSGAMFGGVSVYCRECGCKGGMSDTEPKEPDYEVRKNQAAKLWNAGYVESSSWKAQDYYFPPVIYQRLRRV